MELLTLDALERERYSRISNLLLLRESLNARRVSCIILGLELRSSTAAHDPNAVEALYDMLCDVALVTEEDAPRAWNAYEKHASEYPDRILQINWNIMNPADVPEDENEDTDVLNRLFKHDDPRVRQFLRHASATNLQSIADKRSGNALKRVCYIKNSNGQNYAVSNEFKALKRADVLRCLLETERNAENGFPLPAAVESPSTYPRELGVASYFCLISKNQPRLTVVCDACGAYSGTTPEGKYVSPKTDKVYLMFSADENRLVACSSPQAERILHVYRATHHEMPRMHKTVYTLTNTIGKVVAPHLLHWSFHAAVPETYKWPSPKPHGNSRKNKAAYRRADPTLVSVAMEALKNKTMTVQAAQQLIASKHGVVLKNTTMNYAAVKVRGKVGTLQSKMACTSPDAVKKLDELPGFRHKVFTRKHGPQETSVNLVLVDTRMLKVAAACQPSAKDLKKRMKEVDALLSDEEKYKEFMDNRENTAHDESGYWRTDDGGGWALDTTFGLSDYYVTVLLAELPHIVSSRSAKRAWIPVGVIAHKRKDADTLSEGFFHLSQMMAKEIDGKKKCAAYLLTDQETALYQLLETKPFRHAVHGLCDFHLLSNFADSGFKSFKRHHGGKGRKKANTLDTHEEEMEEESDDMDPLDDSEDSDDEPGDRGVKKRRRLDKHFRTTAVLFGKVEGGVINDLNEPVIRFQAGNIWAFTQEIFVELMKEAQSEKLLDDDDCEKKEEISVIAHYLFRILKDSETIYQKHGPRFRLFIGRSTMFNTTNPIEGFFKRLKQAIDKRRRTLDELYSDMNRLFTEIFQDIVLAVTEGRGSLLKTKKHHPYSVQTMDSREATIHLSKYGLPNNFLENDNFANPLPQKFIDVVIEKEKRCGFIKKVEEKWKVRLVDDDILLISNSENPAEAYQVTMVDYVLYCPQDGCKQRCCVHIVIALGLFPSHLEREKYINGCLSSYFCEAAIYRNAERPGAGSKNKRKFAQKSKNNRKRPCLGGFPDALCRRPEKSTVRNVPPPANDSPDITFRRPTSRASSVSSNTSRRSSIHDGFTGPKPPTRRSQRERSVQRPYSPGVE